MDRGQMASVVPRLKSAYAGMTKPGGKETCGQKNAGLKAVTLIATLNPVSQVLW